MAKKVFSIWLGIQILVGSAGVTVFLHTCHLFGQTDISFQKLIPCCDEEPNEGETIDFNCCSDAEFQIEVDTETDFTKSNLSIDKLSLVSVHHNFAAITTSLESNSNWYLANGPPVLLPADRIHLHQVYRL